MASPPLKEAEEDAGRAARAMGARLTARQKMWRSPSLFSRELPFGLSLSESKPVNAALFPERRGEPRAQGSSTVGPRPTTMVSAAC